MPEIVVIYNDGTGHFRPMEVTSITQDVKNELDTYKSNDYCVARSGTLTIRDGEEPDVNGYYIKSQITYQIDEDGDFVKQEVDPDGVKGDWLNWKTGETVTIP